MLTFKVGNTAGFLNGRKLGDDVINTEFGLLTNGAVSSDGVDANDSAFSGHVPVPRRGPLTAARSGPAGDGRPRISPTRTSRHQR